MPDSSIFWPVNGGTLDKNIKTINRNDEVRARRSGTANRPFRANPVLTVPVPTYRTVVEKALKKCLGGTDVPTPGSGITSQLHTLGVLGFGSTQLPAFHAQLVRDDLNHKLSGCAMNRVHLNFPLDAEGACEMEMHGKYHKDFGGSVPTASFTGISGDILMLRDASIWLDGATEVQTVGLGSASAGTITIQIPAGPGVAGGTTGSIAYNAANAVVQTAMDTAIGAGNCVVSGGPLPGVITITFAGSYAGRDIPTMVVTPTGLTGGAVTVATTVPGGVSIPDLTGFEFTFVNNVAPHWYAGRNVVTQTLGTPTQTRKLWFPAENKLGAMQDVTFAINFGNVNAAQELAQEFQQTQKFVFECTGGPLATTPAATELLRLTLYQATVLGGGAEPLNPRDDITSRFEGTAWYSDVDAADIKAEIVNDITTALT